MSSFSTINTESSFMNSNSNISKFMFFFMVFIGFLILLRLGITALSYFFKPNNKPHLIDGMVDGTQLIVFPQYITEPGAVPIFRSVNASDGIEFTWSVWVYIESIDTSASKSNTYKHIFSKGNNNLTNDGLVFPNNAPGLYLAPNTNKLIIMMNTYNTINEEIEIPDVPMNKWVNVIISCVNQTLNVYVNGALIRSVTLSGVPKQNYGNVFVGLNGGFDGNLSNLWYWNYAITNSEIQTIASNGPNLTVLGGGGGGMTDKTANYLSLRWYLND